MDTTNIPGTRLRMCPPKLPTRNIGDKLLEEARCALQKLCKVLDTSTPEYIDQTGWKDVLDSKTEVTAVHNRVVRDRQTRMEHYTNVDITAPSKRHMIEIKRSRENLSSMHIVTALL